MSRIPATPTARAKQAVKKSSKSGGGGRSSPGAIKAKPAKKSAKKVVRKTRASDMLFPVPSPGDCGALLLIRDAAGDTCDEAVAIVSTAVVPNGARTASRSKNENPRIRRAGTVGPDVCEALAAVSHPSRAKLLGKLLQGPATYGSLQKVTKLKAGPLYHHINQLRLTRLILPKQRDLYELTRGGRNLILSVMALGSVIRDGRRRPVPTK